MGRSRRGGEVVTRLEVEDQGSAKLRRFGGEMESLSGQLKTGLGVGAGIKLFDAAGAAIGGVVDMMRDLAGEVVGAAAQFEQYNIQFEVLLGSAEAATDRLEELKAFAKTTPFNVQEVIEASRLLQTFGGDVLATGESLERVGDIAAGTGSQFTEVALWYARLVDELKSGGQAIGMPLMYLQRMGAISGQTANEMRRLVEETGDGEAAFALFMRDTGRLSGMMDRLSGTFSGAKSNFEDALYFLKAALGEGILPPLTAALQRMGELLSDPKIVESVRELGRTIGDFVGDLLEGLPEIIPKIKEFLISLIEGAPAAVESVRTFLGELSSIPDRIKTWLGETAISIVGFIGGLIQGIALAFVEVPITVEKFFVLTLPRFLESAQMQWATLWTVTVPNAVRDGVVMVLTEIERMMVSIGDTMIGAGGMFAEAGLNIQGAAADINATIEGLRTENRNATGDMDAAWAEFNDRWNVKGMEFAVYAQNWRENIAFLASETTAGVQDMIAEFFQLGDAAETNFGQRMVGALQAAKDAMVAFATDPVGSIRNLFGAISGGVSKLAGMAGTASATGGAGNGAGGDWYSGMGWTRAQAETTRTLAQLQSDALRLLDPEGLASATGDAVQNALREEQLAELLRENPQLAGFANQVREEAAQAREQLAQKRLQEEALGLMQAQVSGVSDQMRLLELLDPEGLLEGERGRLEEALRGAQVYELLFERNDLIAYMTQLQGMMLQAQREENALTAQMNSDLMAVMAQAPPESIVAAPAGSRRLRENPLSRSGNTYILNQYTNARALQAAQSFGAMAALAAG